MSVDETPAIIIDNGSYNLKVGFTGDDDPRGIFRNRVHVSDGADGVVRSVGTDIPNVNGRQLTPLQRGVPCDWDAMESVWEYAFKKVLNVAPEDHRVLLTDRPLSARATREKAVQIMFEKFSTPATYVSMQATLALYGAGRTSGTVVDVGDGTTSVVPIYKGTPTVEAIANVELAGCDMVDYLAAAHNVSDREMAREIMEKVGAVGANGESEAMNIVQHKASNGSILSIGPERFHCGEAMFNPSAIGHRQMKPLPRLIVESVAACKEISRNSLYAYIVLAGGPTMLNGFAERLQKELTTLVPSEYRCKVVTTQHPTLSVWAGGCMVAQSPLFQQQWVTKQEYEEHGADIIHQKCV
uniref:Actin n=1 Tax=Anopheles culicifacies TaxID=139723 RepID=A0A182MX72_9DIPT